MWIQIRLKNPGVTSTKSWSRGRTATMAMTFYGFFSLPPPPPPPHTHFVIYRHLCDEGQNPCKLIHTSAVWVHRAPESASSIFKVLLMKLLTDMKWSTGYTVSAFSVCVCVRGHGLTDLLKINQNENRFNLLCQQTCCPSGYVFRNVTHY